MLLGAHVCEEPVHTPWCSNSTLGRFSSRQRFTCSLLLAPHFDSLMEQILVNFSKEVNLKGVKAWDITLRNINVIHRMYGVTNAQRRRGLLWKFSQVLSRCNALLIHAPLDEEPLDIQSQLQAIISQLQWQSYRYVKMRHLRDGLIDNQCRCHLFFQALHTTYARSNVVHVKQGDAWILDPSKIIDIRVHYFKELIGPQLLK